MMVRSGSLCGKRLIALCLALCCLAALPTTGCRQQADRYTAPSVTQTAAGYTQVYPERKIDGARTTFQTATAYSDTLRIQSDAMMVYVLNTKTIDSVSKKWAGQKDRYRVDMMMALNRDNGEYVQRDPKNKKDVQTYADGRLFVHSWDINYYMVPTLDWIEYAWELVEKSIDSFAPDTITFEEPEMWHQSGYSQGFKEEWKAYYDEEWCDPLSSPEAMFKSMRLKTYLFERILTELSSRIKKRAPQTKIYIATHSTVNYNAWGITAGINSYLDLGVIDGVIGQTWSDTANTSMPYAGERLSDAYLEAYLEYASYLDSVEGTDFYALSDPMADNAALTEEDCRALYRHTLAASLMHPEIQRFQLFPWPERSFLKVSSGYKTLQLNVFNALNDLSGKAVTLEAGTPGIVFGISDSLSWQVGDGKWSRSSNDSFFGMTLPLIRDGIPVKCRSLEQIKTADDLSGVEVLLLSYDCQKPLTQTVNAAIAQWVKRGGTLLYLGGSDRFAESEAEWWAQKGGSPLNSLLAELGLDNIRAVSTAACNKLVWTGKGEQGDIDGFFADASMRRFNTAFTGSDNGIITCDGDTLGIDEAVGKGRFIAVGLTSACYAGKDGDQLLRALVSYALEYTDYAYKAAALMQVRRGEYLAAHAVAGDGVISGRFIDLFSEKLEVLDDVTVKANDSVLLYDVSGLDRDKPVLAFTGGVLEEEAKESARTTVFSITAPIITTVSSRILAPEGLYPREVKAMCGGNAVNGTAEWSEQTRSLLIQTDGSVVETVITVIWSETPGEIQFN